VEARPRITGARVAARARRSVSGSGPALVDEFPGGGDDLKRARLALVAGVSPGGDAVPAEDHPDGLWVIALDGGDVEAELEPGPPPRHPGHPAAEALAGQLLPVGGGGEGDAGVRVQVVHVRRLDQAVHGGVDRRGGAALAERAEVERRDHLVLALYARVDGGQRAQRAQAQDRQARLGQRAEVAARALHPHQLGRRSGDRVGRGALGRGVAARVVGVARVRAEPVGPREQRGHGLLSRRGVLRV
jgi:hypothetical protein